MQILPALVAIAAQLGQIEPSARFAPQPWEDILPGDYIVPGEVSLELRQLYVAWMQAQAEAEHCLANLRSLATAQGKEAGDLSYTKQHIENGRLGTVAQSIGNIFTGELRAAFPQATIKAFVFVRKGWQVVYRDAPVGAPAAVTTSENKTSH